jgi:hypothetical protein
MRFSTTADKFTGTQRQMKWRHGMLSLSKHEQKALDKLRLTAYFVVNRITFSTRVRRNDVSFKLYCWAQKAFPACITTPEFELAMN